MAHTEMKKDSPLSTAIVLEVMAFGHWPNGTPCIDIKVCNIKGKERFFYKDLSLVAGDTFTVEITGGFVFADKNRA